LTNEKLKDFKKTNLLVQKEIQINGVLKGCFYRSQSVLQLRSSFPVAGGGGVL